MTATLLMNCLTVLLVSDIAHGAGTSHWTRESKQQHMFAFGDGAGDEKILMENLPQTKNLNAKIIFSRGKFDQIKIFPTGYLELHNEHVNIGFTPVVAPFSLAYSQVTSGHVWYRETTDATMLKVIRKQIKEKTGAKFKPKSAKVITWEFKEVEPRYPECFPDNQADNSAFCNCLNDSTVLAFSNFPHLTCECDVVNQTWTHTDVCSCVTYYGDFRRCDCDDGSGHRPFDTKNYCICEARGGSESAGTCAATDHHAGGDYGVLEPIDGCDFCGCDDKSRSAYCHCNNIQRYINFGKMSCYLLFSSGRGLCFMSHAFFGLGCEDAHDCESAGDDKPAMCDCILPANPTELDLLQCLLTGHNHTYIWLCDDPEDSDLQYCGCIGSRTKSNTNDEIYCKCLAVNILTSSGTESMCDCLSDQGYTGSETPSSCTKRSLVIEAPGQSGFESVQRNTRDEPVILNTFQAVLVHNKRTTYVYFTYKRLEFHDRNIVTRIGTINDATSAFSGYQHPYPQHIFLRLFLLWDSNMGVNGRWLYRVHTRKIWQQPDWKPQNGTINYKYPLGRR